MTDITELGQFVENYESTVSLLSKQFEELLSQSFKRLFELSPIIQSACWVQYSPHFNDGDPCTFRVCDPSFSNATKEALDGYSSPEELQEAIDDGDGEENAGIWDVDSYSFPNENSCSNSLSYYEKELKNLETRHGVIFSDEVIALIRGITAAMTKESTKGLMEETFGSDVKVVADREGFHIYDHTENHD